VKSTIVIDEFGDVHPSTAPITRIGDTYTMTGDIYETVYIRKSGITFDGAGYTINLSMYPGSGDLSYRIAFDKVIEPIVESFRPEFLLVSVGFDGHYKDPLTALGLTTGGFAMMNQRLNELAKSHSEGRIACFLEGGYNLEVMGKCSLNLLQELAGTEVTSFDDSYSESETSLEYTEELIDVVIRNSPLLS